MSHLSTQLIIVVFNHDSWWFHGTFHLLDGILSKPKLRYIHRVKDGNEVYFFANLGDQQTDATVPKDLSLANLLKFFKIIPWRSIIF